MMTKIRSVLAEIVMRRPGHAHGVVDAVNSVVHCPKKIDLN